MTKHERSVVFTLVTSVCNIILTLIIELLLIVCLGLLFKFVPSAANAIPTQVVLPFILFAGLVVSLMLFVRFAAWIIKTFHLEDKLEEKLVRRYIKEDL